MILNLVANWISQPACSYFINETLLLYGSGKDIISHSLPSSSICPVPTRGGWRHEAAVLFPIRYMLKGYLCFGQMTNWGCLGCDSSGLGCLHRGLKNCYSGGFTLSKTQFDLSHEPNEKWFCYSNQVWVFWKPISFLTKPGWFCWKPWILTGFNYFSIYSALILLLLWACSIALQSSPSHGLQNYNSTDFWNRRKLVGKLVKPIETVCYSN
jgi:hypothetical protein